jgi:pimeloyl-ACP methyl ester carboxylesterase
MPPAPNPQALGPDAPSIVMIHGMWSRPDVWENFISYFEPLGFATEAPALRHHELSAGDAPAELGRVSLTDYVDDLDAAIRRSGRQPILFGHSMGGLIAQHLASRGLARAVILLAPAVPPGLAALRPETICIFRRLFLRWRFWSLPQRLGPRQAAYGLFHRLPPDEQGRRIAGMTEDSGRVLFEIALPALDRRGAARVEVERVGCPLLIVAGAEDRIIPRASSRRLASRYGGRARYVELPNHAHWLMGEPGWQNTAAICAEWLANVLPAEAAEVKR